MKIPPVGAELFDADGQTDGERKTDMMKLIADFRNFANEPKNLQLVQLKTHSSIQLKWLSKSFVFLLLKIY
jgi:hypothetical protein